MAPERQTLEVNNGKKHHHIPSGSHERDAINSLYRLSTI